MKQNRNVTVEMVAEKEVFKHNHCWNVYRKPLKFMA